jgi:hypothetical protein
VQLNVHVPKDREGVLEALDRAVRRRRVSKSQLVLDAIELYFRQMEAERDEGDKEIPSFDLGVVGPWTREQLYEERLNR